MPATSASVTVAIASDAPAPVTPSPPSSSVEPTPSQRTGRYKPHSFFDNPPSGYASGTSTPACSARPSAESSNHRTRLSTQLQQIDLNHIHRGCGHVAELEVDAEARIAFAHYGYIYAMALIPRPNDQRWLVTGSGDTDVKIWECEPGGGLRLLRNFSALNGAALSFAVRDSLLYAGLQDGQIVVWDLETSACIRTIEAHESDVLAMSVLGGDLYTCGADGKVLRVNERFDCTAHFRGHSGIILSSTIVEGQNSSWELITAGNDSYVKVISFSDGQKG